MHTLELVNQLITTPFVDVPNPPPAAPPGAGDKILAVFGWFKWVGVILLVIGLLWFGISLAFGDSHRGEDGKKAGRIMAGLILFGGGAALVGFLAG